MESCVIITTEGIIFFFVFFFIHYVLRKKNASFSLNIFQIKKQHFLCAEYNTCEDDI